MATARMSGLRAASVGNPAAGRLASVPRIQAPTLRTSRLITRVPSKDPARVACRSTLSSEAASGLKTSMPPAIKIDNTSDAFATMVTVEIGDKIVDLLETVARLKHLGLNIRRAKLVQKPNTTVANTFYVTEAQTSEKIVKSARLEEIRMTVLSSIAEEFDDLDVFNFGRAGGGGSGEATKVLGMRATVSTTVDVDEVPRGFGSLLKVRTVDRPGLLVDIVRVLKDLNVNVVSAEVDTIGREAYDEFFITYQGAPLLAPMITLVTNALQYYLALNEVAKEESY